MSMSFFRLEDDFNFTLFMRHSNVKFETVLTMLRKSWYEPYVC